MARQKTAELAKGKWADILRRLGVPTDILSGKHQKCPRCGGKDRFRWDDKDGGGGFFCSQCGPGDGFTLLMAVKNETFKAVVGDVDIIVSSCNTNEPVRTRTSDPRRALREMQRNSFVLNEQTPIWEYLRNRGLAHLPGALRGRPQCPYYEDGKVAGNYDAMLGVVRDVEGKPVTYHVTYLKDGTKADVAAPRKILTPMNSINGSAIRLFPRGKTLGVAEGIETAIAAHQLSGHPVWAVINTNGMKTFNVPDGVTHIEIFGDNDANMAGQAAAYTLANKLSVKGFEVRVHVPKVTGFDWLDVLNEIGESFP